jgi:hypothetical protein
MYHNQINANPAVTSRTLNGRTKFKLQFIILKCFSRKLHKGEIEMPTPDV